MWTISYKGYFIHGYCDKSECSVQAPDYSIIDRPPSLHAAKICITRHRRLSS